MSKPYRPSNGTEGELFRYEWCDRCEHEREFRATRRGEGCKILSDTFAYKSDDPRYPKEWVWDGPGTAPRCLAFDQGCHK